MYNVKKKNSFTYIKNILQVGIGLVIVYLIFSYFKKEIIVLDFLKIKRLILDLGDTKFFIIIILGIFGISILSFYDYFVMKSMELTKRLSLLRIFKISFMTNTINMILGFGGFIGAGLRYYLYVPYVKDNKSLVKAIGMILISMLSGISLLSICVILNIFPGEDLYSRNNWFYYGLLLMSIFLPIYLIIGLKNPRFKTDKYLSIKLTIISFLEWVYAAFLILFILFCYNPNIIYGYELRIVGIIVIAAITGLLSMIPGGIGTFDILVLVGLKKLGINEEITAATILIYRLSYYIIPFIIGIVLLILEIISKLKEKVQGKVAKNDC